MSRDGKGPTVHVCLVDLQETLPNLIPLFMDPPDALVMVTSPRVEMAGIAERIRQMAGERGIRVVDFHGAPATDWEALRENAVELCGFLGRGFPTHRVVFNISGGTKLMAFAYAEALRQRMAEDRHKIIYCDNLESEVDVLYPASQPSVPMRSVLDVADYLRAQGMALESSLDQDADWVGCAGRRQSATRMLLNMALQEPDFIGALNYMGSRALSRDGHELAHPDQHLREPPQGEWARSLYVLSRAELLEWRDGAIDVRFRDAQSARYVAGGWLEELAWHTARSLSPDDVRVGVQGSWESNGELQAPSNEFDLLIVHNNRLLVVECKTAYMRRGRDAQRVLYKLDSLAGALGGLLGTALLLSARPLSDHQLGRAHQQRIDCISGTDVRDLRDYIARWMSDGSVPSVEAWRAAHRRSR